DRPGARREAAGAVSRFRGGHGAAQARHDLARAGQPAAPEIGAIAGPAAGARGNIWKSMWRSALTASLLALVVLAAATRADIRTSKKDAALLREKVATITAHGEKAVNEPRKTILTENEVNSYLVYDAKEQLPTGVVDPWLSALGPGRVSGRAVVDLDAVQKA